MTPEMLEQALIASYPESIDFGPYVAAWKADKLRLEGAERAAHSLDVLCDPMVAMYFPSIRFVIDELLAALAGEKP